MFVHIMYITEEEKIQIAWCLDPCLGFEKRKITKTVVFQTLGPKQEPLGSLKKLFYKSVFGHLISYPSFLYQKLTDFDIG